MKITKSQLRKIIKEEVETVLNEMMNGLVIGDMVNILGSVLSGAKGEIIEFTKTPQGKDAVVIKLTTDAPRKVYGQAGDEVLVKPDFLELDEPEDNPEDDYNWVGHKAHY
jgi:hypothetical protein